MKDQTAPNETDRRIGDVVRLGKVESVDLAAGRCTVSTGDVVSGPIAWLAPRAGKTLIWSPPSVGEQVLLICADGELGLGVALPGIFSTAMAAPDSEDRFTAKFEDGAVITYDPAAHALTVTLPDGGTIEATAPGGVTINAAEGATVNAADGVTINADSGVTIAAAGGGVAITGDVTVNGKIDATGKITSGDDVVVGAITLKTHKHAGVTPGGSLTAVAS